MRGESLCLRGALLIALGLAVMGCQGGAATSSDGALATYAGGEITLEEFDNHVKRQVAAQESLNDLEGDWRVPILEELALREIVAESADKIRTPALEAQIRDATAEIYRTAMTQRLDWNNIAVTNAEVRAFYDERPDLFVDPEKLRLQHIFVRSETGTATAAQRAEARRKLETVREQVLGGADFAAMAKEHSDSADGPAGGWMILKRGARAVPSFIEAAWALEPDEVSEVIDTPAGFHIARLAARIPPVERQFEDVREFATTESLKVARLKIENEYLAEAGSTYNLVRQYERLTAPDVRDDTVLFSLDGEELTVREFLGRMPAEYQPHFFAGYVKDLPRLLDREALASVLLREAVAAGVPEDERVKADLAAATAKARTAAEVDRRLQLRSLEITEAELRDHYEQNQDRFETVRVRTISMIRLAPEKGKSLWPLLKEGERIADEIRGGADFAEIARRVSHHVSAVQGGKLLTQSDDDLRVRLQARARGNRILNSLAVGEVSEAFIGEVYDSSKLQYMPSGVYVVRLDEDFPPRQAPYEEVEELVRANYLRRYYARFLSELRVDMLAEAKFKIIESNLPDLGA